MFLEIRKVREFLAHLFLNSLMDEVTITAKTLHARVRWFRWSRHVGKVGPLFVFSILGKFNMEPKLVSFSILDGCFTNLASSAEEPLLVSTTSLYLTLRIVYFIMCHHWHPSCCPCRVLMLVNDCIFSCWACSGGPDSFDNFLRQRSEVS